MQTITINPNELSALLKAIIRRKKRLIIAIAAKGNRFAAADARYQAVAASIPCQGQWRGNAETEGFRLKKIVDTYLCNETINITKDDEHIVITSGGSKVCLNRSDPFDKHKTERQPLKHKGKVVHAPDPKEKRVVTRPL